MNPNTPAYNKIEWDRKVEAVTLCGKNRGPHDYIPVRWTEKKLVPESIEGVIVRSITHLMCRVCFTRVSMDTLLTHWPEAKI